MPVSPAARPPRTAVILAAAAAAASASGCHDRERGDGASTVTTRLDCPPVQGDLHRTDAAADGRSCTYAGPDGRQVTLAYLALDGRTPREALRPTEVQLRAEVPDSAAPQPGAQGAADADRDDAVDEDEDDGDGRSAAKPAAITAAPAPPAAPAAPKAPEAPQIDRSWTAGRGAHLDGAGRDRVRINLPFLHIDADGTGRAHVRTFGVDVDAGGDGEAVVRTPGGGAVDAHDGGAEMRFGSVGRDRINLVYMVASDHPGPQGFRSGGYIARGPAQGPLVLAVLRSRGDAQGRRDDALRDVKRLVGRNVHRAHGGGVEIDVD